jgi:hypothetical protein
MVYLYAIHDPWFHGFSDGDVDDRAAFCVYEKFLDNNPHKTIIVYVGERYEETMRYYGHFQIDFREKLDLSEVMKAQKVCICAPVKDAVDRSNIGAIVHKKKNGYCQGCKIGCMNFPNASYDGFLKCMTYRYSTVDTMIQFPVKFSKKIDPIYYKDYQEYGYLKLFSPGAIAHIPGLLYRLYCPEMGGGPGTNMLTIQRCLQKHFHLLEDIPVDKDHFAEFNEKLIAEKELPHFSIVLQQTDNVYLQNSLTVMMYFANLIYKTGKGDLYTENTHIYSLNNLPPGRIEIMEEETPPLYDLVVAHATLYGPELPSKEELLALY